MSVESGVDKALSAEEPNATAAIKNLTTIATTLGGSVALGLLAASVMPALELVVVASALGGVAGFLAKNLDKQAVK